MDWSKKNNKYDSMLTSLLAVWKALWRWDPCECYSCETVGALVIQNSCAYGVYMMISCICVSNNSSSLDSHLTPDISDQSDTPASSLFSSLIFTSGPLTPTHLDVWGFSIPDCRARSNTAWGWGFEALGRASRLKGGWLVTSRRDQRNCSWNKSPNSS